MPPRWKNFEDKVREIATLIYSKPCEPGHIAGVDIDGIVNVSSDRKILFEITVNCTLPKVREDINKLTLAKSHFFSQNVYAECFIVIDGHPTTSMKEGANAHNIRVISDKSLSKHFFAYDKYHALRIDSTFGSAIDPVSPSYSPYL